MKAQTKMLLYYFLYGSERLFRPNFRNVDESFESWAYRKGFLRKIHQLEAQRFIERQPGAKVDQAIYRLTERGRLVALGGKDPQTRWNRSWDKQWRIVLFDVPETKSVARQKLRRILKEHAFGRLQRSAWITPDPLDHLELNREPAEVGGLVTFVGRPASDVGGGVKVMEKRRSKNGWAV